MSSRKHQKEKARARRLALEEQLRSSAARRRGLRRAAATIGVGLALGAGIALASGASGGGRPPVPAGGPGATGPEGVAIATGPQLAAHAAPADGHPVDGISCLAGEQVAFHIHVHLTLFVDGAPRKLPGGIGILSPQYSSTPDGAFVSGGSCFYWLHTHAADGIIHIESPIRRSYTLGNFFDVWGQQLGPTAIGPLRGPVTAFYNETRYRGDPRLIPLTTHAQIQLEIGRRTVGPARITFPPGL